MALRGNAEAAGDEINIHMINGEETGDGGIAYGADLIAFVDAFMDRNEASLETARTQLAHSMGTAGMVEASAIAANFQRMVRIADSIGIPVDESRIGMTAGLREELNLNEYQSAQNTLGDI